jgi:AAA family ATP:ADP antiporter
MSLLQRNVPFSRMREFFWPIHRHELKKFIPMLLISFLLTFSYNALRPMKDTMVITTDKEVGAAVIPFIKVWAMFPMSLLLAYIFVRVSNRFSRENVFYIMFSIFLVYFFLFAFVFYPARDSLHAHTTADLLQTVLPVGCRGFVTMYRYWIFTTFYVMAELWSNIVLSLLLWGFANQITELYEAKRFYGLFGLGVNLSGVVSGQVSIVVAKFFGSGPEAWEGSMTCIISLVLVAGLLTMGIFRWLNRFVLVPAKLEERQATPQEKEKFSMRENLRYVLTSNYVLSIGLIIIAYNLVINLVEVLWKHDAALCYPNPQDYNIYMNEVTTVIGLIATFASLFVSGNCIRKFGWTFTAMLTPIILLLTSIGFFFFFFLKEYPEYVSRVFGLAPLPLVVFFGSLQNCASRAAKYSVFDATKEMAFVPLSDTEKVKAKAAVDGVCNRLGKSVGSVIYNILFFFFSSITESAPFVALALFIAIGLWILCVHFLGKQFNEITKQKSPAITVAAVAAGA